MFYGSLKKLEDGIRIDDLDLSVQNIEEGRIKDQKYFDLCITSQGNEKTLMRISVYMGRKPDYMPWVEMFGINARLEVGDEIFEYFGSTVEEKILDLFTSDMNEGGRIFVEYQRDKCTREELSIGVPEPCTRLGYELFKRDFTWFKDWYFAEGFYEGGQKLQAEKAIDDEHRRKHMMHIRKEVDALLEKDDLKEQVEERAYEILDYIEK